MSALESRVLARTVRRRLRVRYLLRRPTGKAPADGWPLLIYLHGAGAKGNRLDLVAREPLLQLAATGHAAKWLIACPQCPAERSGFCVEDLDRWLDDLLATLPADPRCVCLTGQSMGGRGAYEWAYERASRFAALLPVCAFGLPALAPRLRGLPVWSFHGARDEVVPVARAEEMHAALRAAGVAARFNRLARGAHAIGRQVYARKEVWKWLSLKTTAGGSTAGLPGRAARALGLRARA